MTGGGGEGTTTSEDGSFSIKVPSEEAALIISAVGFTEKEVIVGVESQLSITLSEAESSLDEIVVVGYGVQRKRDLTGSVAQISGTKLKDQPLQTFDQGLSGRATGVSVSIPNGVLGNAPVIRVRGVSSISLSSSPLIVIDGVPSFSGDVGSGATANNLLGDINPSDIESVEVLKDASATAIYGSRAGAGVMLITTKKANRVGLE